MFYLVRLLSTQVTSKPMNPYETQAQHCSEQMRLIPIPKPIQVLFQASFLDILAMNSPYSVIIIYAEVFVN